MTLRNAFAPAVAVIQARWQALGARERLAVRVAMLVVGLALIWSVAVAPALRTLATIGVRQAVAEADLAQAKQLQQLAQTLATKPRMSTRDSAKALQLSVEKAFGSKAQWSLSGDRATVTLKSVDPKELADWLAMVRLNAHTTPAELQLSRSLASTTNPVWSGRIVVTVPNAP